MCVHYILVLYFLYICYMNFLMDFVMASAQPMTTACRMHQTYWYMTYESIFLLFQQLHVSTFPV